MLKTFSMVSSSMARTDDPGSTEPLAEAYAFASARLAR